MTDGAEPPARRSDVEWVVLDGETVLYDPKANMMHWLNVSAAAVWDACDGTASVDQIVGAIEAEFAGQDDEISRDVPAPSSGSVVRGFSGRGHRTSPIAEALGGQPVKRGSLTTASAALGGLVGSLRRSLDLSGPPGGLAGSGSRGLESSVSSPRWAPAGEGGELPTDCASA